MTQNPPENQPSGDGSTKRTERPPRTEVRKVHSDPDTFAVYDLTYRRFVGTTTTKESEAKKAARDYEAEEDKKAKARVKAAEAAAAR